ncbi:hypothetical protein KC845_03440 [Candidatus Kaiserbacteria bacterium]|nr:hypothetical protein [Candidatus Kaiserbacteria bacterium]
MERKEGKISSVSSLFEKYKKILKAPQSTVVQATVDIIEDLFSIRVDSKNIKYNTNSRSLQINVSGPLKSEILLRKKELLNHLTGRLGVESAPKEIF